jgi:hypothetical protein
MAKTTTQAVPKKDPAEVLQNETVILQLQLRRPGSKRKVSTDEIDAGDADKKLLSVAKDIYNSDELEAIVAHDTETRTFLRSISVPNTLLKGGHYCLRTEAVQMVDEYLDAREAESNGLIADFLGAYPTLKKIAQENLGKLFDERDYPSEDQLRRAFRWSVTWLALETPEALKKVRAAMYDREQKKLRKRFDEAAANVTVVLRQQVAALVSHMVDQLGTNPATGKRKGFRDSLVSNFREFLTKFPFRNLGDDDLTKLVTDAGKLLDGVDPDMLRKNDGLRESVAAGFEGIKGKLDALLVEQPERAFAFEE